MREVIVRQFMTFHDRPPWPLPTANGKIDNAIEAWMVQAKGSYWTSLRAAAQPLFHSDRRGTRFDSMTLIPTVSRRCSKPDPVCAVTLHLALPLCSSSGMAPETDLKLGTHATFGTAGCRLASFAPSMADAAEEQAVILAHAADSGEPVDMQQHLARITLNVTGTTVFGCAVPALNTHTWLHKMAEGLISAIVPCSHGAYACR